MGKSRHRGLRGSVTYASQMQAEVSQGQWPGSLAVEAQETNFGDINDPIA